MIRLLLLLLVGTIYAQDLDDYDYDYLAKTAVQSDLEETAVQGDLEKAVYPGSQEDGSDMADDLQTPDLSHYHLDKFHSVTMEIKKERYHDGINPGKATWFYLVFITTRTFWNAQHLCRYLRGDLSSLHNIGADTQVRCLAKRSCANQNYAWIGVWKPNTASGYRNLDGSKLDFTNWASGQNRQTGTWCTAISLTTGQWFTFNCNTHLPYICTV